MAAESVTVRLTAATIFQGLNPRAACADALPPGDRIASCSRGTWRTPLALPARPPGSRVDERDALPTDERLAAVRGGASTRLAATYFSTGATCSSPLASGTQPATSTASERRGEPAWEQVHININTEMNYWRPR